jgi:hypothetical protein
MPFLAMRCQRFHRDRQKKGRALVDDYLMAINFRSEMWRLCACDPRWQQGFLRWRVGLDTSWTIKQSSSCVVFDLGMKYLSSTIEVFIGFLGSLIERLGRLNSGAPR